MNVEVVGRSVSTLPADDDHPYRTGAWRPNFVEYDATDLDVIGEIPADLDGVYLRNTENPVHDVDRPALPPVRRRRHGAHDPLRRRPRRVPQPLRAHGRASRPSSEAGARAVGRHPRRPATQSLRDDGWGARTRMKDASSTDVVVHAGRALTSFYQCGDLYVLDPVTLEQLGRETWNGEFPTDWGISAHTEGRREHRRDARVQLRERRAVHALRRRRREQRARALDRRAAARARASRTTWRSPSTTRSSTTARCSGTPSCSRRARTCRASGPTCRPASRSIPRRGARDRHPLVRGRSHVRPALGERVRGRRRDRARRLLPGRPDAEAATTRPTATSARSAASTRTACRRVCTAGASTSRPARRKEETLSDRDHGVPDDQRSATRAGRTATRTT